MKRYFDGTSFIKWLESDGLRYENLTDSEQRAVREWRLGRKGDSMKETADGLVRDRGLTWEDAPDTIWSRVQIRDQRRRRQLRSENLTA